MDKFSQLTSTVAPLDMDHVDTDMIIPAQYLTKVDRDGYGEHVFQRLREQDPQFVLNQGQYQQAQILLTQTNFGCGSSREHAVWALMQAGIEVVIAESFSDIFHANAGKNGLLTICLAPAVINELMQQAKSTLSTITVDLKCQTLTTATGKEYTFTYDSFRRNCLLQGLDDLAYLLEATK